MEHTPEDAEATPHAHDDDSTTPVGNETVVTPVRQGPYYPSLDVFVEEFIAPMWECNVASSSRTWCPKWWKHDGANFRLSALWQSWESMRVNDGPCWAARWLNTMAEPIMRVLLDPMTGPFDGCSVEHGHRQARHEDGLLPTDATPGGLFTPRD